MLSVVVLLSGCGGAGMALKKGQDNVSLADNSIVLFSVKMANRNKPGYQPRATQLMVKSGSDKMFFSFDDPIKELDEQYREYLVSLPLKPGKHQLDHIYFTATGFMIKAYGGVPLGNYLDVKPGAVMYAGKIDATIRERQDGEVRAGSVIPLIDQSVTGLSSGTVDVEIKDAFDEDLKVFINEYPGLKKVKVEKSVMGPWVRPKD